MSIKHPVKVGDYLYCYGAIEGRVEITEESMEKQKQNTNPNTFWISHDGELKEVSAKSLYHHILPQSQTLINIHDQDKIREELQNEGLL